MDKKHILQILSTRGQALLEYILLLIFITAISLGLLVQFNQSIRDYTDMLMGDYLTCLLQTGSLPGSQICNIKYQGFKYQVDRSAKTGGSNPSPYTNAPSATNQSQQAPASQNAATLSEGPDSKIIPLSPSKRSLRGSGSQISYSDDLSQFSNTGRTKKVGLNKGNIKNLDGTEEGIPLSLRKNPLSSNSTDNLAQGRLRYISADKGQKKQEAQLRKPKIEASQRDISSSYRGALIERREKKLSNVDLEIDISWGKYIKYLLIFGIILIVILVIGGQLYQIKKNMQG